ncbi:hypothetical protein OS493_010521 [Desmophyllum pertusum]|uniref:Uncharacterized protein n=1 Tax=Desmophyllum pertusum TaxID=174260 RepID=A0A9X0A4E4_9CNID|nr:hypothetical protein OS493_010521 [Desmophyllum pertusum]
MESAYESVLHDAFDRMASKVEDARARWEICCSWVHLVHHCPTWKWDSGPDETKIKVIFQRQAVLVYEKWYVWAPSFYAFVCFPLSGFLQPIAYNVTPYSSTVFISTHMRPTIS